MKHLMIKLMTLVCLFASVALPSVMAQANQANIVSITNPSFSNGIQIGDLLNRMIVIEVDAPYQISKTALPMKGEVKNGIELADISVSAKGKNSKNIITINLRYQVFTSAAKPVVMQLPAVLFAFTGGAKDLSISVPVWRFWFSPLVAEGLSNAKENLQPQFAPSLINIKAHYARFWLSLALFMLGLIGLIYINADKRWLPFMNGEFAQAHRNLKKLVGKDAGEKQAWIYLHQAFNKLHGENLFAHDLELFLANNAKFTILRTEILQFFEQSNASLFASQSQSGMHSIKALIALSKRLRDCERGV